MDNHKQERLIDKIWKSEPTIEGAGVHLKRAFGFHEVPLLDPFLLLDDFRSENPADYKAGFPWHPHRGRVKENHNVFAYVIDGEAYFDHVRKPFAHDAIGMNYFDMQSPCPYRDGTLVLYKKSGTHVTISTDKHSVRFLLVSGKPLNEPVAWYGPIVMNTHEELRRAFQEYNNGTFIKHK